MIPRCYNCKFFATSDTGYSNWTVMGADIDCLKKHFETTEESYSWKQGQKNPDEDSEFFKRAESCQDYVKEIGTQIHLDVDRETKLSEFKDDPEVYAAALEFFGEDFDNY
jgi:hypothetical protein